MDRLVPGQALPELLGEVRHHRVQQPQAAVEHGEQHLADPRARGASPVSAGLHSSMYQSQSSPQKKW